MVHVDHTGPEVSVLGLRGRLGRHGLYVHNSTDLSAMTLAVRMLSLIHISEPTRLTAISYAVFCLKKKKKFF